MEKSQKAQQVDDLSNFAVALKQTHRNVIIKQPSKTQYGSPMGTSYNLANPAQNTNNLQVKIKQSEMSGRLTHTSKRQFYTIETESPQMMRDYTYAATAAAAAAPSGHTVNSPLPKVQKMSSGSVVKLPATSINKNYTSLSKPSQQPIATSPQLKNMSREDVGITRLSWHSSNTSRYQANQKSQKQKFSKGEGKSQVSQTGVPIGSSTIQRLDQSSGDLIINTHQRSRTKANVTMGSSLDFKSTSRQMANQQKGAGNGMRYAPSSSVMQSPSRMFIERNKGIKDIVEASMRQSQSINFDNFKKKDQVKEAYVTSTRQHFDKASKSRLQNEKTEQSILSQNFQSVNEQLQTMPIAEVANNSRLDLPKVKGLKDTMQMMMTNYQSHHRQPIPFGVCNKLGEVTVTSESHVAPQRHQSMMSQTISSSFYNSKYKAHPFAKVQRMTDDQIKTIVDSAFKINDQNPKNSRNKSLHDQTELLTVASRNVEVSRGGLLRKTHTTMQADVTIDKLVSPVRRDFDSTLSSIRKEDPTAKLDPNGTVRLNNLRNTFESLDFVSQAQVMRIGLNEKRQDRFLGMIDSKKGQVRKNIEKFSKKAVLSKSTDPSKIMRQKKTQGVDYIQVLEERIPEKFPLVAAPAVGNVKTRELPPSIGQDSSLKIDQNVLQEVDKPTKLKLNVAIRTSPKLKPYLPPKKKTMEEIEEELKAPQESILLATIEKQVNSRQSTLMVHPQPDNKKIPSVKMSTRNLRMKQSSIRNMLKQSTRSINLGDKKDTGSDDETFSLSGPAQRVPYEDIVFEEEHFLQDSSSWTEESLSDVTNMTNQQARRKRMLQEGGVMSVTSSEIAKQTGKQSLMMEDLMKLTKEKTQMLYKKEQAKLMQGRSHYGFPTQEVFQERKENEVEQNLEDEAEDQFGLGPSYALAMMNRTKEATSEEQPVEAIVEEINSHVQFLTDQAKMTPSGENGIFRKDPLNKKKGADFTFYELCEIETLLLQDNANEFDKKVLYSKINKVSNVTKVLELKAEHPEYIYYMECSQDTDTPLPILSHISNYTLALANYTLSAGHCRALNRAAKYLQTNISRVLFDNCGIDDGEMADLLQAFVQFKDFKSIIYRMNDFQEDSLECLQKLLKKGVPYHLEEFRISNCKLTPNVTSELISTIHQRSFLKQFELANAPLSDQDIYSLAEFMNNSKHLIDFDLSMNDLRPQKMEILLTYLRENKRLTNLNLGYNNIGESSLKDLKATLLTEAKVVDHLSTFLQINRKLVHLNLTSTNLSENVLLQLLPAIKKAKVLQGIHLSGNPGVTKELKEQARALLKTKEPVLADQKVAKFSLAKVLEPETMQRLERTFLRESVKIKQINNSKRIVQNGSTDDKFFSVDFKLILMRYLHNKKEIPGSGQWQMLTRKLDHCWICDYEMKGYIFWYKDMALTSKKLIKTTAQEKENIYNEFGQIAAHDEFIPAKPKPFIPENPRTQNRPKKTQATEVEAPKPSWRKDPTICGQFNDWKPRPMMTLFDFFQKKEKPEDLLNYRAVFNHFVRQFLWGSQYHIEKFEECTQHHINLMDAYIKERRLELYFDWQYKLQMSFAYKKPFFVNSEEVKELDFEQIYIAPVFAKSGRQCFVIQPGNDASTVQLYKTVVDFRQETVAGPINTATKKKIEKVFKKANSVFARWRSDTEQTREKGFYDHDINYWKLERFVKDQYQREKIEQLIFDNYFFLKSIYIELSAETSFPNVSLLGWSNFCQRVGVVDGKFLNLADVDRFYIASRIEDGQVKQQNLSRFMFFEALIRTGGKRYWDYGNGECATPSEAIAKLIEKIKENWVTDNWQGWRDKHLYQIPVNEVMIGNQNELRQVYQKFFKTKAKFLELDDTLRMFQEVPDVGLSASQVQYCFGMCKMTMIYEKDKKSSPAMTELEFVEFLELIGRVAHVKFLGSELEETTDLATKIEYVLDDLFVLIEAQRNEREEESSDEETEDCSDDY